MSLEKAALASGPTRAFWRAYLDDPQVIRLPRRPGRAAETTARQDAVFMTWRDDRYDALKALAAKHTLGFGDYQSVARLAVSGTNVGPSITGMFRVLGRERVQGRLQKLLATA